VFRQAIRSRTRASSAYNCLSPISANALQATTSKALVVIPNMAGTESTANSTSATPITATSRAAAPATMKTDRSASASPIPSRSTRC